MVLHNVRDLYSWIFELQKGIITQQKMENIPEGLTYYYYYTFFINTIFGSKSLYGEINGALS